MDGADCFATKLRRGKIGEGYIARWLRRRGYHILPIYEREIHEGKGPVLYQAVGPPLVAPDMLCFNGLDRISWIEAKTKSAFSWHRISERWVTGIDLDHYKSYIEVSELVPWDVWLLFLQLNGRAKDSPPGCPTGLFGGKLGYLQENENHRHCNWGKGGMVYWASDMLTRFAELDEVIQERGNHG